jgi:hypothetical protein
MNGIHLGDLSPSGSSITSGRRTGAAATVANNRGKSDGPLARRVELVGNAESDSQL